MKHGWLALVLLIPAISIAEVAPAPVVETAITDASATENPAPTVAAEVAPMGESATSVKSRPTLVEKLKAQEAASPRSPAPAWGNMIFGLIAVLGLILGMAWVARRVRGHMPGLAGQLTIVESAALGPRERLCIVEVDGKRLLLGVTQQSITVLQTSDCENKKDEADSMFSEKIKKMLQNGTPNGR